jgi:hypothetical protein
MACYLCEICYNMIDGDFHPPIEYKGRLICDDCEAELEDLDNG